LKDSVRTIHTPSPSEAAEVITSGASKRKALIVLGSCEARAKGRKRRFLGAGERVILIKEDGSVLVHQVWGYKPVIYHPPGSLVYATHDTKEVTLFAVRKSSGESLQVTFSEVYLIVELRFRDEYSGDENRSEIEMRNTVMYQPDIVERGLRILTNELPVRSGFVDLLGVDARGRMVAMGFKDGSVKTNDVNLLIAYVSRLRAVSRKVRVRGIFVAPAVNKSAKRLLAKSGLEFKKIPPERFKQVTAALKPLVDEIRSAVRGDAPAPTPSA
jgi:RecB family endonuclease NucS